MTEGKSRLGKASDTRHRVLTHARDLFLSQGFAATSTRQVAEQAGVTERTLFNIVASKGELLRQVMLLDVFDQDQAPLLERRDFTPVRNAESKSEFVNKFARWVTRLHVHTAPFAEVIRAAGSVSADAAQLWNWGNDRQVNDCADLIALLERRGWLRSDLIASDVAVSLAVLCGHETYWRLVTQCGWPADRYRHWLTRHCQLELFSGT